MSRLNKLILSATPVITGSLPRIPFGMAIGRNGGKKGGQLLLVLCFIGIL
jgi:nitrate/nitrite transporter NarK